MTKKPPKLRLVPKSTAKPEMLHAKFAGEAKNNADRYREWVRIEKESRDPDNESIDKYGHMMRSWGIAHELHNRALWGLTMQHPYSDEMSKAAHRATREAVQKEKEHNL